MQDQNLFQRIVDFDPNSDKHQLSFARRLAKRQDWAMEYACQVLQEYRRFMYLAAISDREISPSIPIDEAWHLHLEDPEHYQKFCAEAIGKYIEHRPASDEEDAERMKEQYARTLKLYLKEFGEFPHRHFWRTALHNKLHKFGSECFYAGLGVFILGVLLLVLAVTESMIFVFGGLFIGLGGLCVVGIFQPRDPKSSGAGCSGGAACGSDGGGCGGGGCGGG